MLESDQSTQAHQPLSHLTTTCTMPDEPSSPTLTLATAPEEQTQHTDLECSRDCAECSSPIRDLCPCTIYNMLFHLGCLHDKSSGTICRTCAATLHSDSDTQEGEIDGPSTASPRESPKLQSSPSTDDDSFISLGGSKDAIHIKQLSPQGRPPKLAACVTCSAANSSKQPLNYSQNTLSFASKRASNTNTTGDNMS